MMRTVFKAFDQILGQIIFKFSKCVQNWLNALILLTPEIKLNFSVLFLIETDHHLVVFSLKKEALNIAN